MTKPAPGPDQPPIPVRLVTFNIHHGVGRRRPARPPAAGDRPGRGGGRRDLPAGGRPALRAAQRERRPGAAARPGAGHAAGLGSGARRAASRRSAARRVRQRAAVPAADPDQRRAPAARRRGAALRAAHDDRAGRRRPLGDHHAPEPLAAATAPRRWPPWPTCTPARWRPASSSATSTPARTPRSWRPCASGSATPGSWPASATTAPGWRFWQHDEGHTHPARSPHRRIDQVWVTQGVAVAAAQVLDGGGASRPPAADGRPAGPQRASRPSRARAAAG